MELPHGKLITAAGECRAPLDYLHSTTASTEASGYPFTSVPITFASAFIFRILAIPWGQALRPSGVLASQREFAIEASRNSGVGPGYDMVL